ncbi:MAG: PKD domain-containing protein [Myxococcales bacterium]|nr:PKD domain-containing protein [Myxococcales bacterium]
MFTKHALPLLVALTLPALALADDAQVLIVPYAQSNPMLPHPAHSLAPVSLKAMLRNATCTYYRVHWDVDRDGDFDDEAGQRVERDRRTDSVRDIGRLFRVPAVDHEQLMNLNVRVVSECDGSEHYGTYRLFVHAWQPPPDPRLWTQDQVEVLGAIALDEVMWFNHRHLERPSGDHTRVDITGRTAKTDAAPLAIWLNAINDHQPAYPPDTVLGTAQTPLPEGWAQENERRWRVDPYAEDSVRLLNNLLLSDTVYYQIPAADEEATCGLDPKTGAAVACPRLPGTTDRIGIHVGTASESAHGYQQGITLGGLATTLPALAGVPIPVGHAGVRGHTFEWLIQQLTDYAGYMQIDSGCALGGWYYQAVPDGYCNRSDASIAQWGHIGLESAEVAGRAYGIVVPNRFKFRIAENLVNNQADDGGSRYRTGLTNGSTFQLTGGALVGTRWLGAHRFSANDATVAFPGQSELTRGKLRQVYDRYLAYSAAEWNAAHRVGNTGWLDGFFREGDPLCGNANQLFEVPDRCANTYALYSFQKGFRTGEPEIRTLGVHEWYREFATYYVRAQRRLMNDQDPWEGYESFGEIWDDYCERTSVTCQHNRRSLTPIMAGLVLTPTIFNAKPFALAEATPAVVTEGCIGGRAGRVTFEHHRSFHPNDDARLVSFEWDVDARDGLWWETGAAPDFQEAPDAEGVISGFFEHTYLRAGEYAATLRVVDDLGQWRATRLSVRVDPAANVPPSVTVGGPYYVTVGQAVQLDAVVDDINAACGDAVDVRWDVDGDGAFDDATGENPLVPFAVLQNLPVGVPQSIRLRATDSEGLSSETTATLVVFPRDPVARAAAYPNPAACGQPVTFDATGSHHADPRRRLVQHDWDLDGAPGYDAGGPVLQRAFNRFGAWTVRLRVVDDLGGADEDSLELAVDVGNRPPVARVAAEWTVPSDQDLRLDASASYDPDGACGDAVVEYRWDINGDGDYDDPIDARGPAPVVSRAAHAALTGGDGTRQATLQVVDLQGATSTRPFTFTVIPAAPVPVVVQTPNPSTVDERDGYVSLRLDARASHSRLPGVEIQRVDWDGDNNGTFEASNYTVVTYRRWLPTPVDPFNLPPMVVGVRVTDSEGRQATTRVTLNVVVGPAAPTADPDPHDVPSADPAERGYHVLVGEPLVLDASDSVDPNGDAIVVLRWDLNHDPEIGFDTDVLVTGADLVQPAAPVVTVSPETLAENGMSEPGTYELALVAEDATGLSGEGHTTVTVYPVAPQVVLEADVQHVAPGQTVSFDASGSDHAHPGITIDTIRWDLDGDGLFDDAEGPRVDHAFTQFTFDAPVPVTVQVTDSRGHAATATWPIHVDQGNQPPAGVAGGHRDAGGQVDGPYVIVVGEDLQLSAVGSHDPNAAAGDGIVSYRWDLDRDGVPEIVTDVPVPPVVSWPDLVAQDMDDLGVHPILLTVEDRFGETSTAPANVLVVRGPQAHMAAPTRASCGESVVLDGRGSTSDGPVDQGFGIVEWAWDLDADGQFDDALGPRITFPAVDSAMDGVLRLVVALRITDGLGHQAVVERVVEIDVQNQAPTADAGGPYSTGPLGDGFVPVLLDGRGSFDPNGPCDAVVAYKWDLDGDGVYGAEDGEPEGALVEFTDPTWRPDTSRTVSLVACDALGACSPPSTAVIEVLHTAPPAGSVATPTPDDCVGSGAFSVTLDVADPEGDRLDIEVWIANRKVAESHDVPTRADGAPVRVALPVEISRVPEGRHEILVQLTDAEGGFSTARSPGRVTFDRTPPVVTIGRELGADVCYAHAHVPNPRISVSDELDPAPTVEELLHTDTCTRRLEVTAVDACGNRTFDDRTYLLADAPAVVLNGPDNGARVAQAQYTWDIEGNPACVSAITASVVINGREPQPYPENSVLDEPGVSVVTLRVANCMGLFREHVRWVRINFPPQAVAVPPDGGVLGDLQGARYVAIEGAPLTLDGSASRPPEDDDTIQAYRWDFDADGAFDDGAGAQVAFPTVDDGLFDVGLQVADDLGATGEGHVRVRVIDVDPVAHAGGPYQGVQGREVRFDASASRAGSWADPIHNYRWNFGDGVVDEGALLVAPSHLYEHDGWFEVSLTVLDEDSADEVRVPIYVEDVNPIIHRVNLPQDPKELYEMTLSVEASPGAPGDPITRYEWDFDGDGRFDYGSADGVVAVTSLRDAGTYPLRVRVRDPDSYTDAVVDLRVRECTFTEAIQWVDAQIDRKRAAGAFTAFQEFSLTGIEQYVTNGLWGERWSRRGNTLLAVERMVVQIGGAIGAGADLGLELWALARQQYREVKKTRDALLVRADGPGGGHPSVVRAQGWIQTMGQLFEGEAFWRACHDPAAQGMAQEVWYAGYEAYFWLMDATDPCTQGHDGFAMPDVYDPVARSQAANLVNVELQDALRQLSGRFTDYLETGAAGDDWGPGWQQTHDTRDDLAEFIRLVTFRVGSECEEDQYRCITDSEALDLLLEGVSLVRQMSLARAQGVYTRNWQSCVMLGLKFRTELSILRTEFACGRFDWTSQRVRQLQSVGLGLVEQGRIAEALDFYGDPEMQCVMRETYNQCLVQRYPGANRWRDYPAHCLDYIVTDPEEPVDDPAE